jgi:hypothetical protein
MSGFASKNPSSVSLSGNVDISTSLPYSSFYELNVAELTPVAQCDFIYGINTNINIQLRPVQVVLALQFH